MPQVDFLKQMTCPVLKYYEAYDTKEKPRDISGCVETEIGSGNLEPIFVSGGCGPGEDGESHLGSGSLEVPAQEPSAPCHPLDGGERVLDGASSSSHEFGIGSRIHASECVLIQMALH